MKRFLLISFIITQAILAQSQGFEKAIGIRGGWTPGFEYRFYTDDANSYKLLLGTRDQGLQLHALKEFHQYDLFTFTDRLTFVYGLGVHAGYERWEEVYVRDNMRWHDTRTAFLAGLDGLVGLEYLFYEVPISLGIEAKPYFDLLGEHMFKLQPFDFAFTIKYLF
ncbi:MAG: hypothetical protein R3182_08980 [Draconibacterium sp.]|nr:hypothetical protein [Draconibacterium sp.]